MKEIEFGPCYLSILEPCSNNSIQFYLYDGNSSKPILLDNHAPILPYDLGSIKFKIIIHGYAQNDLNGFKLIRKAYLKHEDTMVIIVDWSRLSRLPCYPQAAINTKKAGECTAQFLIGMEQNNEGFKAANVHVIGFSLGAHVASFASNAVEKALGEKFSRISGLDPALPFFATARHHWKLDSTDANFVDVIHTNAGVYGKLESCGHLDFYVNNGQYQPACQKAKNENLCSHIMALDYFAESINSRVGFYGYHCDSYFQYVFGWCKNEKSKLIENRIKMGEHCEQNKEGIVFVNTHKKAPYAMG
ncbi:hypothetical protein PVAND_012461 [Polypedilum vanderplanki]|uniref:Lipase domain-containing protein n=1 Tax=Polypedilum vanderplanki TaxID=319348 RepID=A0A9J6CMK4_POLVA|nr:hypothetical protein PVAND_012461 [Polypedilum vanderplanki]